MKYLGTKFFGADSAICIIDINKKKIFASSTERYTRYKHDWRDISKITNQLKIEKVHTVSHSFSEFSKKDTCFENKSFFILILYFRKFIDFFFDSKKIIYKSNSSKLRNILHSLSYIFSFKNSFFIKKYIRKTLKNISFKEIIFFDHHLCHAASSYYFSNLKYDEQSYCLTLDAQGDGHFSKFFEFKGDKYKELASSPSEIFSHKGNIYVASIGELYSNFTEALGLIRNNDEGKTEALAAYGLPNKKLFKELVELYFLENYSMKFKLDKIKKFYDIGYLKKLCSQIGKENFASTIQCYLEYITVEYLKCLGKKYKIKNICFSGGVFANIILSLKIYESFKFKKIFVVPAMTDDGTASGAAVLSALNNKSNIKWIKKFNLPYYGDSFTKEQILSDLKKNSKDKNFKYLGKNWPIKAAEAILDNKVIAIFNNSMEYGPRALGNRSIMANAFNPKMRDILNLKVKKRPKYQPFCPSILKQDREQLFLSSFDHKFMAIAFRLKKKFWKLIPSMTHIDGTSRPQFVDKKDNKDFYKLLKAIKKRKKFGVVLNTSFNLHGRAMVRTPQDAIDDFLDCNIDKLYLGGFLVIKKT